MHGTVMCSNRLKALTRRPRTFQVSMYVKYPLQICQGVRGLTTHFIDTEGWN